MIVLDGAENTGKTTLAGLLADRLGWPVRHWGKDDGYRRYLHALENPEPQIWDRCFWDEVVYQPVKRPGGRFKYEASSFWRLEGLLRERDPLVIHCRSPLSEQDSYLTPRENEQVRAGFEVLFRLWLPREYRVLHYSAWAWDPAEYVDVLARGGHLGPDS